MSTQPSPTSTRPLTRSPCSVTARHSETLCLCSRSLRQVGSPTGRRT